LLPQQCKQKLLEILQREGAAEIVHQISTLELKREISMDSFVLFATAAMAAAVQLDNYQKIKEVVDRIASNMPTQSEQLNLGVNYTVCAGFPNQDVMKDAQLNVTKYLQSISRGTNCILELATMLVHYRDQAERLISLASVTNEFWAEALASVKARITMITSNATCRVAHQQLTTFCRQCRRSQFEVLQAGGDGLSLFSLQDISADFFNNW
jgi:hypothetical protein